MNIETKYAIGDEVCYHSFAGFKKGRVTAIKVYTTACITCIHYTLNGNDDLVISEHHLYTEQEVHEANGYKVKFVE